jgi:hypothetical protein
VTDEDALQLIQRAQKGDEQAMEELRKNPHPGVDRWLEKVGDLALQAESALLDHICGPNLVRKEGLKQKLAKIRSDVAGPSASPLQRLAAERVAACWLQVQAAEWFFANSLHKPEINSYFLSHLERAHRRYESILRTSAQIQRLLKMVVQVNIGAQQVNVASP